MQLTWSGAGYSSAQGGGAFFTFLQEWQVPLPPRRYVVPTTRGVLWMHPDGVYTPDPHHTTHVRYQPRAWRHHEFPIRAGRAILRRITLWGHAEGPVEGTMEILCDGESIPYEVRGPYDEARHILILQDMAPPLWGTAFLVRWHLHGAGIEIWEQWYEGEPLPW